MRRHSFCSLLVAAVALAAAARIGYAQDPPPPPASSQQSAQTSGQGSGQASGNWQPYQSSDGAFSILLPGRPREEVMLIETPVGRIEGRIVGASTSSGLYAAQFADIPVAYTTAGEIKAVLDGARDLGIARVKGRLISERQISYDHNPGDKYPGREVRVEVEAGMLRAQHYLAGRRMYMLLALTSSGEESDEQKRFFASFKILKRPAELEGAGTAPVTPGSLLGRLQPPPPEFFRQTTSWRDFSPAEGGFRVSLPSEPHAQAIPINPADERVKLQIWIAKGDEILCQIVSQGLARAPQDEAERKILFDSIRQGLIESAGARIESESPTTFAGRAGREFKISTGRVNGIGKVILTDRAIYVVSVFSQSQPGESAEAPRFFDSFRLTAGPERDE